MSKPRKEFSSRLEEQYAAYQPSASLLRTPRYVYGGVVDDEEVEAGNPFVVGHQQSDVKLLRREEIGHCTKEDEGRFELNMTLHGYKAKKLVVTVGPYGRLIRISGAKFARLEKDDDDEKEVENFKLAFPIDGRIETSRVLHEATATLDDGNLRVVLPKDPTEAASFSDAVENPSIPAGTTEAKTTSPLSSTRVARETTRTKTRLTIPVLDISSGSNDAAIEG